MKKLSFFMLISMVAVFLCGCVNTENYVIKHMSEIRHNMFDAVSSSFYVTFSSGYREEPYLSDGKHNSTVEFGIIELDLFDTLFTGDVLGFTLTVNEDAHTGKLERNPFTGSFMADVECLVGDNQEVQLSVNYGAGETVKLVNKSKNWEIGYKKALEIATKKMSEKLKQLGEKATGEAYLKIINNRASSEQKYFWYFNLKTAQLKSYSLVIDTSTGSILAMTI